MASFLKSLGSITGLIPSSDTTEDTSVDTGTFPEKSEASGKSARLHADSPDLPVVEATLNISLDIAPQELVAGGGTQRPQGVLSQKPQVFGPHPGQNGLAGPVPTQRIMMSSARQQRIHSVTKENDDSANITGKAIPIQNGYGQNFEYHGPTQISTELINKNENSTITNSHTDSEISGIEKFKMDQHLYGANAPAYEVPCYAPRKNFEPTQNSLYPTNCGPNENGQPHPLTNQLLGSTIVRPEPILGTQRSPVLSLRSESSSHESGSVVLDAPIKIISAESISTQKGAGDIKTSVPVAQSMVRVKGSDDSHVIQHGFQQQTAQHVVDRQQATNVDYSETIQQQHPEQQQQLQNQQQQLQQHQQQHLQHQQQKLQQHQQQHLRQQQQQLHQLQQQQQHLQNQQQHELHQRQLQHQQEHFQQDHFQQTIVNPQARSGMQPTPFPDDIASENASTDITSHEPTFGQLAAEIQTKLSQTIQPSTKSGQNTELPTTSKTLNSSNLVSEQPAVNFNELHNSSISQHQAFLADSAVRQPQTQNLSQNYLTSETHQQFHHSTSESQQVTQQDTDVVNNQVQAKLNQIIEDQLREQQQKLLEQQQLQLQPQINLMQQQPQQYQQYLPQSMVSEPTPNNHPQQQQQRQIQSDQHFQQQQQRQLQHSAVQEVTERQEENLKTTAANRNIWIADQPSQPIQPLQHQQIQQQHFQQQAQLQPQYSPVAQQQLPQQFPTTFQQLPINEVQQQHQQLHLQQEQQNFTPLQLVVQPTASQPQINSYTGLRVMSQGQQPRENPNIMHHQTQQYSQSLQQHHLQHHKNEQLQQVQQPQGISQHPGQNQLPPTHNVDQLQQQPHLQQQRYQQQQVHKVIPQYQHQQQLQQQQSIHQLPVTNSADFAAGPMSQPGVKSVAKSEQAAVIPSTDNTVQPAENLTPKSAYERSLINYNTKPRRVGPPWRRSSSEVSGTGKVDLRSDPTLPPSFFSGRPSSVWKQQQQRRAVYAQPGLVHRSSSAESGGQQPSGFSADGTKFVARPGRCGIGPATEATGKSVESVGGTSFSSNTSIQKLHLAASNTSIATAPILRAGTKGRDEAGLTGSQKNVTFRQSSDGFASDTEAARVSRASSGLDFRTLAVDLAPTTIKPAPEEQAADGSLISGSQDFQHHLHEEIQHAEADNMDILSQQMHQQQIQQNQIQQQEQQKHLVQQEQQNLIQQQNLLEQEVQQNIVQRQHLQQQQHLLQQVQLQQQFQPNEVFHTQQEYKDQEHFDQQKLQQYHLQEQKLEHLSQQHLSQQQQHQYQLLQHEAQQQQHLLEQQMQQQSIHTQQQLEQPIQFMQQQQPPYQSHLQQHNVQQHIPQQMIQQQQNQQQTQQYQHPHQAIPQKPLHQQQPQLMQSLAQQQREQNQITTEQAASFEAQPSHQTTQPPSESHAGAEIKPKSWEPKPAFLTRSGPAQRQQQLFSGPKANETSSLQHLKPLPEAATVFGPVAATQQQITQQVMTEQQHHSQRVVEQRGGHPKTQVMAQPQIPAYLQQNQHRRLQLEQEKQLAQQQQQQQQQQQHYSPKPVSNVRLSLEDMMNQIGIIPPHEDNNVKLAHKPTGAAAQNMPQTTTFEPSTTTTTNATTTETYKSSDNAYVGGMQSGPELRAQATDLRSEKVLHSNLQQGTTSDIAANIADQHGVMNETTCATTFKPHQYTEQHQQAAGLQQQPIQSLQQQLPNGEIQPNEVLNIDVMNMSTHTAGSGSTSSLSSKYPKAFFADAIETSDLTPKIEENTPKKLTTISTGDENVMHSQEQGYQNVANVSISNRQVATSRNLESTNRKTDDKADSPNEEDVVVAKQFRPIRFRVSQEPQEMVRPPIRIKQQVDTSMTITAARNTVTDSDNVEMQEQQQRQHLQEHQQQQQQQAQQKAHPEVMKQTQQNIMAQNTAMTQQQSIERQQQQQQQYQQQRNQQLQQDHQHINIQQYQYNHENLSNQQSVTNQHQQLLGQLQQPQAIQHEGTHIQQQQHLQNVAQQQYQQIDPEQYNQQQFQAGRHVAYNQEISNNFQQQQLNQSNIYNSTQSRQDSAGNETVCQASDHFKQQQQGHFNQEHIEQQRPQQQQHHNIASQELQQQFSQGPAPQQIVDPQQQQQLPEEKQQPPDPLAVGKTLFEESTELTAAISDIDDGVTDVREFKESGNADRLASILSAPTLRRPRVKVGRSEVIETQGQSIVAEENTVVQGSTGQFGANIRAESRKTYQEHIHHKSDTTAHNHKQQQPQPALNLASEPATNKARQMFESQRQHLDRIEASNQPGVTPDQTPTQQPALQKPSPGGGIALSSGLVFAPTLDGLPEQRHLEQPAQRNQQKPSAAVLPVAKPKSLQLKQEPSRPENKRFGSQVIEDLHSNSGRAGKMFAARRERTEKYITDETNVRKVVDRPKEDSQRSSPANPLTPSAIWAANKQKQDQAISKFIESKAGIGLKLVKSPWEAALENPVGDPSGAFNVVPPRQPKPTGTLSLADLTRPTLPESMLFPQRFPNSSSNRSAMPPPRPHGGPPGQASPALQAASLPTTPQHPYAAGSAGGLFRPVTATPQFNQFTPLSLATPDSGLLHGYGSSREATPLSHDPSLMSSSIVSSVSSTQGIPTPGNWLHHSPAATQPSLPLPRGRMSSGGTSGSITPSNMWSRQNYQTGSQQQMSTPQSLVEKTAVTTPKTWKEYTASRGSVNQQMPPSPSQQMPQSGPHRALGGHGSDPHSSSFQSGPPAARLPTQGYGQQNWF